MRQRAALSEKSVVRPRLPGRVQETPISLCHPDSSNFSWVQQAGAGVKGTALACIFRTPIESTTARRVRARGLQSRNRRPCRPRALTRRSGCEISVLAVFLDCLLQHGRLPMSLHSHSGVGEVAKHIATQQEHHRRNYSQELRLLLCGRIFPVPPPAVRSLLSLSPSDGERARVRGRERPCAQRLFPLSPSDGERAGERAGVRGRGEGPSFRRSVVLTCTPALLNSLLPLARTAALRQSCTRHSRRRSRS